MTKFEDLTDQRFGKLVVVNRVDNKNGRAAFLCKCDCGEFREVPSKNLKNGDARSCGCSRRKYHPSESSAKLVYRAKYSDGDLSFEDFMKLSALNCHYCNLPPSNNRNMFLTTKTNTEFSLTNGNFNYNGLDRIDSNFPHNFNNLVPACSMCNKAKSDMAVEEFKKFIFKSYNYINLDLKFIGNSSKYFNLTIDTSQRNRIYHPAISSAKRVHNGYNDGDLTFEYFLKITQHNCVYCGIEPNNNCNAHEKRSDASQYARDNGNFIYNGLDRLDSSKGHNVDNVVPCCHSCNWAKGDKSVEEYKEWIIRAHNHIFS